MSEQIRTHRDLIVFQKSFAAAHGYIDAETSKQAIEFYDEILRMIVAMIHGSSKWCVDFKKKGVEEVGVEEKGESYSVECDYPVLDQALLLAPSSSTPDSSTPDS
ncbi:MAG: hypothetical protein ABI557_05930, partial [Aureliella sp.]